MHNMGRRSFLGAAMAAFPLALAAQSIKTSTPVRATRVPAGEDRFGEHHSLGVSSTDFKVSTQDSSGGLFIMEHTNRKQGGPPRHLHHNEDEWLYENVDLKTAPILYLSRLLVGNLAVFP
jgi:hypothetical protein